MRGEKGQVAVALAVWLLVLLVFLALILDIGRAQLQRLQVGSACEAAALAGASTAICVREVDAFGTVYSEQVVLDPVKARGEGLKVLGDNLAMLWGVEVLESGVECDQDALTVRVWVRVRIPARVLGVLGDQWRWLEVRQEATAKALPR